MIKNTRCINESYNCCFSRVIVGIAIIVRLHFQPITRSIFNAAYSVLTAHLWNCFPKSECSVEIADHLLVLMYLTHHQDQTYQDPAKQVCWRLASTEEDSSKGTTEAELSKDSTVANISRCWTEADLSNSWLKRTYQRAQLRWTNQRRAQLRWTYQRA